MDLFTLLFLSLFQFSGAKVYDSVVDMQGMSVTTIELDLESQSSAISEQEEDMTDYYNQPETLLDESTSAAITTAALQSAMEMATANLLQEKSTQDSSADQMKQETTQPPIAASENMPDAMATATANQASGSEGMDVPSSAANTFCEMESATASLLSAMESSVASLLQATEGASGDLEDSNGSENSDTKADGES